MEGNVEMNKGGALPLRFQNQNVNFMSLTVHVQFTTHCYVQQEHLLYKTNRVHFPVCFYIFTVIDHRRRYFIIVRTDGKIDLFVKHSLTK